MREMYLFLGILGDTLTLLLFLGILGDKLTLLLFLGILGDTLTSLLCMGILGDKLTLLLCMKSDWWKEKVRYIIIAQEKGNYFITYSNSYNLQ